MAGNYGTRIARVDVLIGGVDQAKQKIREMKDEAEKLGNTVEDMRKRLSEAAGDPAAWQKWKDLFDRSVKEQEEVAKTISETQRAMEDNKDDQAAYDRLSKSLERSLDRQHKLAELIAKAQAGMSATKGNQALYDNINKELSRAERDLKDLNRNIRKSEENTNAVEKYLTDISGQTLRNLQAGRRALMDDLLGIDPKNVEYLERTREELKKVNDEIKHRKGDLVEFSDIIGDIGNVSERSLGMAEQRLKDLLNSTKLNAEEMQAYREQLSQVQAESSRRVSSRAKTTMGSVQAGTFDGTIAETREAIKLLEQYGAK